MAFHRAVEAIADAPSLLPLTSAVAILRPGERARLDVYHNRHAAHPIHLEDLDAGNIRHFRLSQDVPPMTAGWEKVPARNP